MQPTPPIPIERGIAAIILVVQHPVRHSAAVLSVTLFDDIRAPRRADRALSVAVHTDFDAFLRRANAFEECQEAARQGFGFCTVRAGHHRFVRHEPIRMHDGLGLVIEVPMFLNEQVWWRRVAPRPRPPPAVPPGPDTTSLMARRPRPRPPPSSTSHTSSTSSQSSSGTPPEQRRRTVVFTLDGQLISVLLPDGAPEDVRDGVARALQIQPQEIATLIRVVARPDDLVQMHLQGMLIQRRSEMRHPTCQRLVLFDSDITEPNDILPGAFRRSATWIPRTTTRLTMFRLLGLEHFLRDTPEYCQLWHNNALVDASRSPPLIIEDGDYIRIFVGQLQHSSSCDEESDEMAGFQLPADSNTAATVILADSGCQRTREISMTGWPQRCTTAPTCNSQDPPPAFFGPPPLAEGPIRPPVLRATDPSWLLPARMLFYQNALALPDEDDPHIEWITWFLCVPLRIRSEESRPIRLGPDRALWMSQLSDLWRDLWLEHLGLQIYVVTPEPARAEHQTHVGHLLLVQGHIPQQVPVLITMLFQSSLGQRLAHLGAFLPTFFDIPGLLQLLRLDRVCQGRGCYVTIDGHQVPEQGLGRVDAGDNVQLTAPPRQSARGALLQLDLRLNFNRVQPAQLHRQSDLDAIRLEYGNDPHPAAPTLMPVPAPFLGGFEGELLNLWPTQAQLGPGGVESMLLVKTW